MTFTLELIRLLGNNLKAFVLTLIFIRKNFNVWNVHSSEQLFLTSEARSFWIPSQIPYKLWGFHSGYWTQALLSTLSVPSLYLFILFFWDSFSEFGYFSHMDDYYFSGLSWALCSKCPHELGFGSMGSREPSSYLQSSQYRSLIPENSSQCGVSGFSASFP